MFDFRNFFFCCNNIKENDNLSIQYPNSNKKNYFKEKHEETNPFKEEEIKQIKVDDSNQVKTEESNPKKEEEESKPQENEGLKQIKIEVQNTIKTEDTKPSTIDEPKKEDNKIEQPKKTSIADKIKNLENAEKQKIEDKKEEKPAKPMTMAERIKMMEKGRMNILPRPEPEIQKRRHSAFENKIKFNPAALGLNNEENNKKPEKKTSNDFANKLNNMKKMFEGKGPRIMGGPRPSAQFTGMPKFDVPGSNNNNQKLEIIEEKPDNLKVGYNPVDELEKNLDKIVVKKDKKKKKKIKSTKNEFSN